MYNQFEHRNKLKQDAENILFEMEFAKEIEKQLAEKRTLKDKTLAEKLGYVKQADPLKRFTIEGDDENKTLMWRSLFKDCAFYFDVPTIQEEIEMKRNLQRKYDHLF